MACPLTKSELIKALKKRNNKLNDQLAISEHQKNRLREENIALQNTIKELMTDSPVTGANQAVSVPS